MQYGVARYWCNLASLSRGYRTVLNSAGQCNIMLDGIGADSLSAIFSLKFIVDTGSGRCRSYDGGTESAARPWSATVGSHCDILECWVSGR